LNIRSRLWALILATLLPMAILGAVGAYMLVQKERESFERGALDSVRALMTAIDAELHASITALEVLARSPRLDQDDLAAFRLEAERVLEARRGDWSNIVVSHPETAAMLMNLLVPPDAPLFKTLDPTSVIEAARSRRPAIGAVVSGGVLKRPLFTVRVPVLRDGRVKYVISAVVETPVIASLVDRQAFSPKWAVAVLDSNYGFVVRRPAPEKLTPYASESLKQALQSAPQGFQRGQLIDGSEIYRAFQRSSLGGWSASIAVPRSVVEESLEGVYVLLAGLLGAAVLGLGIARWLAYRISHPISALAAAASALGRGEPSALPPPAAVDEVRELARALAAAAVAVRDREERQRQAEVALRAADRAKDEFLAMLGHELRNPLASVSNAAQLLRMARHQPEVLETVSAILSRQVEHMTRLVDDLLEVGRVTGGKVRLERVPLDLAKSVRELVDAWTSDGRFLHHQVHTDLNSVWVSADSARIDQVISNLLDNAIKYTPGGGHIRISVRAESGRAILEVSDTGLGMPPELIGRVFDLFVQGERSLAREPGGLGIGLTMVKRLVELHDGTIRAASGGADKGAQFTVELPAIERPEDLALVTPHAPTKAIARRILIVEDDDDARYTLAALLRLGGHEVFAAENGSDGVAMAASLLPDVALVDIGLPDLDGYELARRLRSNQATSRVALVALTGYGTQEDRRAALAAGFDEHLAKPVELEALEAVLSALGGVAQKSNTR
jgi:signal transduction histidine kinase/ActR/RegA family two-component response regulator